MAVTRITASPRWFRHAAETMKDVPLAKRELLRAAERRGLIAELRGDEVRVLAERLPHDDVALRALLEVDESERREAARPRGRDVVLARMALGKVTNKLVGEDGKNGVKNPGNISRLHKKGVHHDPVRMSPDSKRSEVMSVTEVAAGRRRRTTEDWDALAEEILPELQNGKTLKDFRDLVGSNDDAMRTALARLGYNAQGEPWELEKIAASRPQTLAKRVAQRRRAGSPWWEVIAATGLSYSELKQLLANHGYESEAKGRQAV